MSDKIVSIFQFLERSLGMHPATVAVNALLLALVFAFLAVFLLVKLKGARVIIGQLGKRLGYDPPYGDGVEIFDQESQKEIVERDTEKKIEQLEQRVGELEAEGANKDANVAALQQRSKELEEQLQLAATRHNEVMAQAGEQAQANQNAVAQLEQRMREMESESNAKLAAAQQRSMDLEDKLQQANLWSDKTTALANDQAQAHQKAVEQLEQRMRTMEADHIADLTASQRRSKDLEDQLQQAALQNERVVAQAGEQERAHQSTVSQFEGRIRQMEAEGNAYIAALERRSKDLEEQLHQAFSQNDQLMALAGEQAQAHRTAVEQLEQRMRDQEAENNAVLAPLQQRSKELEEQLQRATIRHERVAAQAGEQMQAYRITVEKLEQRLREMEAEGNASLAAHRERLKELEDKLQRAHTLNETLTAQSDEQTQVHRMTVERLEQRLREMEAEGNANLAAHRERSKELEDKLQRAHMLNETLTAQSNEQAQTHHATVEKLEQRMREMEAVSNVNLAVIQQHSKELEDQLQHAAIRNERVKVQAAEQLQAYRITVEQLEQRMREMEAANNANVAALQQRSKSLEDQLQQAINRHDAARAEASEAAQAHKASVEQLERRTREMEAANNANMSALQQRSKSLEDQLQQATDRHDAARAEASEAAQAHKITVEQLERRARDMQAESSANLAAVHQRSKELEDQLHQTILLGESEKLSAQQEALERSAGVARMELRIQGLEAEKGARESHLMTLEAHIKELEDQLRQAADRAAAETAKVPANASEQFLRRAEFFTACAIGAILPHGLVAAEAYASAALAANPQNVDAPQLMAELARIRRAYPEGLPSVVEAITTFDERMAAFFAADLARAADIAEDEAQRRYRAGLNRSALLVVNVALELRQKTEAENSPGIQRLQETKASLLARLGDNSQPSNPAPSFAPQ